MKVKRYNHSATFAGNILAVFCGRDQKKSTVEIRDVIEDKDFTKVDLVFG